MEQSPPVDLNPASLGFDETRLTRIQDWQNRYVASRKFAGSAVLIARHGKIAHFSAAGKRDLATEVDFTRDTIARIYSMTKPITSVGIMMLAERGLFTLDTPVSDFIPAFANPRALLPGATSMDQTAPCAAPTLHHLLTHTSGLSYPFNPGILAAQMDAQKMMFGPRQGTLADMADAVATLPLAFVPGTRWEYSVATDILGRVLEVVSGKSLADFFDQEIFAPLGMTETGFSVPQAKLARFAALYTPLAGDAVALNSAKSGGETLRLVDTPATSPFLNATMHSGGGGLVGTIDDYMRFCETLRSGGALGGNRILSPATLDFMMRNHLPGDIASMGPQSFAEQPMEGMGFGLGGSVVLNPGRVRVPGSVGDFSWGGMASTFFWIDRARDMSVVFFTQLSPSSSYPARAELKSIVHGCLLS